MQTKFVDLHLYLFVIPNFLKFLLKNPSLRIKLSISDQEAAPFQVQSDAEELLIIKTRESLLDALTAHVKANHEYE